jgi:hypothetical protein
MLYMPPSSTYKSLDFAQVGRRWIEQMRLLGGLDIARHEVEFDDYVIHGFECKL